MRSALLPKIRDLGEKANRLPLRTLVRGRNKRSLARSRKKNGGKTFEAKKKEVDLKKYLRDTSVKMGGPLLMGGGPRTH